MDPTRREYVEGLLGGRFCGYKFVVRTTVLVIIFVIILVVIVVVRMFVVTMFTIIDGCGPLFVSIRVAIIHCCRILLISRRTEESFAKPME